MRQLKFRVWHNESFHYLSIKDLMEDNLQSMSLDPVMQYTGLEDKNGKEIYEGDIVHQPYFDGWDLHNKHNKVIDDIRIYYMLIMQQQIRESELEVIGNIYENGEFE